MLPYVYIGPFPLPSYWLMGVMGIAAAALCVVVRNRAFRVPPDDLLHIALLSAVGAGIGAKLLFLVSQVPYFVAHRDEITLSADTLRLLLSGGMVFYGGLIGGLAAALIYMRKYHVPVATVFALVTPALPLFHGFARIGCFLTGCCWGVPSERFGIAFTHSLAAPNYEPLLPVQLIESGYNFLLFLLLIAAERRMRRRWMVFPLYAAGYAVMRFALEFFRGDDRMRGIFFGMSTSQWVSIGILLALIGWYIWDKARAHARPGHEKA